MESRRRLIGASNQAVLHTEPQDNCQTEVATLFAFASLSASGVSPVTLAPGDMAALADDSPSGVQDALESPRVDLLRGVERNGAQGDVRGLLLRAAAGAAFDKIF